MVGENWSNFYEVTDNRDPRGVFLEGFHLVDPDLPQVAIEVGFGVGNEVKYLLDRGWEVTAIDAEPEAAEYLKNKTGNPVSLKIITNSYENTVFHPVTLVHAGFSLPFCHPTHFTDVWMRLTDAIIPNGIFCGQLFGRNDAWSDNDSMVFHSRSGVEALLDQFKIIKLEEVEGERDTATGGQKYWHYFNIIAIKLKS